MSKTITERHELYQGNVVIDFYPKSHRYKLVELDGEKRSDWLKSPSSIVSKLDKSGALKHWAVNMFYDKVVNEMRDGVNFTRDDVMSMLELGKQAHTIRQQEAASIGSVVHDYAKHFHSMKSVEEAESFDQLDEDGQRQARAGASALEAWHKQLGGYSVTSEFLVYSRRQNFVGTCDDLVRLDNGDLIILDFKTSKGVYTDQVYQVASYFKSREEEKGEKIAGARLVHLIKDDILDKDGNVIKKAGEFGEVWLSRGDLVRAYRVFKALKVVAETDPLIEKLLVYKTA